MVVVRTCIDGWVWFAQRRGKMTGTHLKPKPQTLNNPASLYDLKASIGAHAREILKQKIPR